MTHYLRTFAGCFLVAASVLAAAPAQTDTPVGDKERQAAKRLATECLRNYAGGDPAKFADLTHPKVVTLVGGREKFIAMIKGVNDKMREAGWRYGEVVVSEPTQFAAMGSDLATVVPCSVEYRGGDSRKVSESFLLGVSSDRGKTWTFIEGAHASRERLKELLPNLPDAIKLPGKK
jgi:hypothetical protein